MVGKTLFGVPVDPQDRKPKQRRPVPKEFRDSVNIQTTYGLKPPKAGEVYKLGSVEPDEIDKRLSRGVNYHRVLEPYTVPYHKPSFHELMRKRSLERMEEKRNVG